LNHSYRPETRVSRAWTLVLILYDSPQAKDEVELLMRRDRAGCWISMDELIAFESREVEVLCEKERWATGRLVLEIDAAGEREWSLELRPVMLATQPCGGVKDSLGSEVSSEVPPNFFDPGAECQLSLELCMVGTCSGNHLAMTRESALQVWKVVSPRSFVQHPSMGAIAEMCSSDSWSEEDSDETDAEPGGTAQNAPVVGTPASLADSHDVGDARDSAGDGIDAEAKTNSPWNIVPWKRDMSMFDRAEVLRNVRKRYEDLMHEYHATSGGDAAGSEDLFRGELTWFSAGIRIGVGVGLGVCLGLGLGVGILVNGYKVSRDRLGSMRQALSYRQ